MSTLLDKFGKFDLVKLSTKVKGGVKKCQISVNVVCERPLSFPHLSRVINGAENIICLTTMLKDLFINFIKAAY